MYYLHKVYTVDDAFDERDVHEYLMTRHVVGRIDQDPPMLEMVLTEMREAFHAALKATGMELMPGHEAHDSVQPNEMYAYVDLFIRGRVRHKEV